MTSVWRDVPAADDSAVPGGQLPYRAFGPFEIALEVNLGVGGEMIDQWADSLAVRTQHNPGTAVLLDEAEDVAWGGVAPQAF